MKQITNANSQFTGEWERFSNPAWEEFVGVPLDPILQSSNSRMIYNFKLRRYQHISVSQSMVAQARTLLKTDQRGLHIRVVSYLIATMLPAKFQGFAHVEIHENAERLRLKVMNKNGSYKVRAKQENIRLYHEARQQLFDYHDAIALLFNEFRRVVNALKIKEVRADFHALGLHNGTQISFHDGTDKGFVYISHAGKMCTKWDKGEMSHLPSDYVILTGALKE